MRHLVPALALILAAGSGVVYAGDAADSHQRSAAEADKAFAELDRELARLANEDPATKVIAATKAKADAVAAADSGKAGGAGPDQLPAAGGQAPSVTLNLITTSGGDPMSEMDQVISSQGLKPGIQDKNGKTLIIATGFSQVQGKPGTVDWAAARIAAYNMAELRARAEIAKQLSVEVLSGRQTALLSNSGEIEDPTLPAASKEDILKKAQVATPAEVDAQLKKLGAKVDPDAPIEKKRLVLGEAYESYVRTRCAAAMEGCATLAVTEGPIEGNQGMVVGIVWSENLAKLSHLFTRAAADLPPKPPAIGKRLEEQIPTDPMRLLRCFGVQRCVDETGEIILVAYGQGGFVSASPAMRATALQAAWGTAGNNALAALKSFVYEKTTSNEDQEMAQLAAEVENTTTKKSEATVQRAEKYLAHIKSGGGSLNITGQATFKRWSGKVDGSDVAGVVLTWSPRSMRLAKGASAGKSDAAPGNPTGGTGGKGAGTTMDPSW